ncbi:hypothetical protein AGR7A_Lc120547 [Agrobacterium deltaense NCPPB 1641]|uniref:Uncharacterized protein n=1 Tax=Agrobacterium deltaense NCPPB 1641 TaxID=1183425 RepID=A0A1S7TXW4_9HYPH|nr:hypothetical protein AGR7A_Lc120547 [Agrobacterium deltaense NCPPB 1641]
MRSYRPAKAVQECVSASPGIQRAAVRVVAVDAIGELIGRKEASGFSKCQKDLALPAGQHDPVCKFDSVLFHRPLTIFRCIRLLFAAFMRC